MKQIIVRPVITEKSLLLAQKNKYTFKTAKAAVKGQIAKVVSGQYKVEVTDVQVISMHGKERRAGRKQIRIKLPDWKKAIVTLKPGQTIAAFQLNANEDQKAGK